MAADDVEPVHEFGDGAKLAESVAHHARRTAVEFRDNHDPFVRLQRSVFVITFGLFVPILVWVTVLLGFAWLALAVVASPVIALARGVRWLRARIDIRRRALPALPGETLVTINITGDDPLFPALVTAGEFWNGALIPRFRRDVAEHVVDWVNTTYKACPDGPARASWDGDTIVVVESQWDHEPGHTPDRVEPDDDGRYCIGGYLWTWEAPGSSR